MNCWKQKTVQERALLANAVVKARQVIFGSAVLVHGSLLELPKCAQFEAVELGLIDVLLSYILSHRADHGQFTGVTSGMLGRHPDILKALFEDIAEMMTILLKYADPASDYVFTLIKKEGSPG